MKFSLKIIFFTLFVISSTLSFAQLSGLYTIDSSRVTSNRNFQSFDDCASSLNNGGISGPVTIDVVRGSGPYNNQFLVDSIVGSSSLNSVTLNGNNELIRFNTNSINRAVISISNAKNFIIDSLNVNPQGTQYGIAYYVGRHVDSITISNSTITFADSTSNRNLFGVLVAPTILDRTWGSPSGNANHVTIINNTILGSTLGGPSSGIRILKNDSSLALSTGTKIINNVVENFSETGFDIRDQENFLIAGNDISRFTRNSIPSFTGINVIRSLDGEVEKNIVHDLNSNNLFFSYSVIGLYVGDGGVIVASKPVIVSNNVIYNIKSRNRIAGITHSGGQHTHYYHNSVYIENTLLNFDYLFGIEIGSGSKGITAKNNSIFVVGKTNSNDAVIGLDYALTNRNLVFVSDNNNVYIKNNGSGGAYFGTFFNRFAFVNFGTLANWKASTLFTLDQNSYDENPQFYSFNDLRPLNPLLDNKGTPTLVNDDINGVARGVIPDIGAYETDSSLFSTIPYYPIDQINNKNIFGVSDSTNVRCWTSGTVLGINLVDSILGIENFISEYSTLNQEGIFMYNSNPTLNYTPNEGDSLRVLGIVTQTDGMTSFYTDSIEIISNNAFLPMPSLQTRLTDTIESRLVQYDNLSVTRAFTYSTGVIEAKNGQDTIVILVNNITDVDDSLQVKNLNVGDTICSIIGVGYQIDNTFPFTSNYAVIPMAFSFIDTISCQTVFVDKPFLNPSLISVFPNPTNRSVFIENKLNTGPINVTLFNSAGQEVFYKEISSKGYTLNIDEAKGVYYLKVESGKDIEVIKLIKN